MTRNRISGDYRRDCQSSFQCGLLLWISHFAFSSKEFRVAGSIVSSYGESYDSLFLFIHLSAYLPRNRDRIFMRVKRSILRVSLYFAGFSCVRSRHEMRRNIFFSWTFVRRTGNNTKTFNSSGQLLPRKKKNWSASCRYVEYREHRVWHVTHRELLPSNQNFGNRTMFVYISFFQVRY